MINTEIEGYRPAQASEVIDLWNRVLGAEFPMTERLWRQNVDTDPNYALGDALIARDHAGAVVGLALVAAGVSALKERGVEECGIDWTRLVAFYGRLGFYVWRSYYRCAEKLLV